MKYEFEDTIEDFLIDFREKFIEFFSSWCSSYDYMVEKEKTAEVANEILNSIFTKEFKLGSIVDEVMFQMKKDEVFIGFLINKVLFFLVENYLLFLQEKNIDSGKFSLNFIKICDNFSHEFEKYIEIHSEEEVGLVDFKENNCIYSRNNILDIFEKIKSEGKSIKLMNLYQGYLISAEGKIVEIDDEEVVIRVEDKLQEIAMKLEGKAYIVKDKFFNRHIKADIVFSNFSNNTIVLNNFIYLLNLPAVQRKFPRIYPKVLINAKLTDKNKIQISGNLYDISKNGVGLISDQNANFEMGSKVDIEFYVIYNNEKHTVKTSGEIIDIIHYFKSYRYCLKIFPDDANREIIKKYINKRECEIIEDLRSELEYYLF